jgi:hypothetical protein
METRRVPRLSSPEEEAMGRNRRRKRPAESEPEEQSLREPEKMSPVPGAAPPEEPQVDELLTPEEEREYRRAQRERSQTDL